MKTDYERTGELGRKIDAYKGAYGVWSYRYSTNWHHTRRAAREWCAAKNGLCIGNVKANFAKG